VIYKEGEPSTNVYIIKSGEFEMLKKVKEVKSGAEAGKIDSLIHGNGT
jgi:CRP-like cAMP-binding protein